MSVKSYLSAWLAWKDLANSLLILPWIKKKKKSQLSIPRGLRIPSGDSGQKNMKNNERSVTSENRYQQAGSDLDYLVLRGWHHFEAPTYLSVDIIRELAWSN